MPGKPEPDHAGVLHGMDWKPISSAPFDRYLELAVFDAHGQPHALVFPSRRILGGWMDAETEQKLVGLLPTHWREWHGAS
jgi:hypothetical protein